MKHIKINEDARTKLMKGIDAVADIVKATLGPCGSNVILKKAYNIPTIVNDGVSIAKEIVLEDPTENAGAELLTSAASCTNTAVGDGTTTTCILTQGFVKEGFNFLSQNPSVSPISLRECFKQVIDEEALPLLEHQVEHCESLDELQHVATISVGGNEALGEEIGKVLHKVGAEGIVNIENSMTPETTWTMVEGYKIDRGYMSPYAINNTEKFIVDYPDCLVLCCYHKIIEKADVEPLFNYAHQVGKHILLIVEEMDESLFAALQVNLMRKVFNICPVKAPGFGFNVRDYMNDIAKLTGCVVYADDTRKMRTFTPEDFGFAKKVTANRENTCILRADDADTEELQEYVASLRNQLAATENPHLADSLKERISKLTVGVATVSVGATTEAEQLEKKLRIEDAINATRAALKGGIVVGGGAALRRLADQLEFERGNFSENDKKADKLKDAVIALIAKVLRLPEQQIIINSGADPKNSQEPCPILPNVGYNGKAKTWMNLRDVGIVDPALVTKSALENAASIASIILTTHATIISEDKAE